MEFTPLLCQKKNNRIDAYPVVAWKSLALITVPPESTPPNIWCHSLFIVAGKGSGAVGPRRPVRTAPLPFLWSTRHRSHVFILKFKRVKKP